MNRYEQHQISNLQKRKLLYPVVLGTVVTKRNGEIATIRWIDEDRQIYYISKSELFYWSLLDGKLYCGRQLYFDRSHDIIAIDGVKAYEQA